MCQALAPKSCKFQKRRKMRVEGKEDKLAKNKEPHRKGFIPETAQCKPEPKQGTAKLVISWQFLSRS